MSSKHHSYKTKLLKKCSPPIYKSPTITSSSEIDDTDEDTTFTLKDQKSISSSNSSIHSYNAAVVQKFDDPTIPKNVDSIIISQNNGLDCVNTSKHTSQSEILQNFYDNVNSNVNNDNIILSSSPLLPNQSIKTVLSDENEVGIKMQMLTKMNNQISQLYRQVTNMSYDIRRVLEAVDRIEDKLNASKNPNMTNNSFYEQFTIEYISDMDSLNLVERKIVNHGNLYPDYRNQSVYSLSKQTGKTIKQSVKRIFQKMFHDDILCHFSYHGIRKKDPFSTLNICAVILESIKKDSKYSEVQLNDIEDCIKIYLSQAPFRLQREQQKCKNIIGTTSN